MELILIVMFIYAIAILLLSIIALKGPTIGDQVLAIDVLTYISLVLFTLLSIYLKQPLLIVLVIPLALWVYSLDIYIAKYLEHGDLGA
ncbi:MAG: monovalent cation/H+ antiporter complex subunit F [Desulfurococcaceae archaeon]|jgi:multicomponent Na+:H+ antiporter subunit F|nr:monovalent cation/H+ antiporter complex subunit F [Desulfurococcaceae archaeon]